MLFDDQMLDRKKKEGEGDCGAETERDQNSVAAVLILNNN